MYKICILLLTVFSYFKQASTTLNTASCMDLPEGECDIKDVGDIAIESCSGRSYYDLERNIDVRSLTLCNYPDNVFDVSDLLDYFPKLENFTLMSSNVTYIRGSFPENGSLKVLNFTNLVIEKIRNHLFLALNSLQILDLRNNRLNQLSHPRVITKVNSLEKLYLQGNKWNCANNLDWVLYLNASIVQDMQNLTCSFPYPEKPLKPIATLLSNLRVECPSLCVCTMPHAVTIPVIRGGGLMPVILVNCSNKGLEKFPEVLPQNTTTLLLNGNKIENVDALISNRFYRGVVDIYLDNNQITNIDDLEGAYWLSHFRVFSLKSNLLTQLPTYVLDNALQRNHNAAQIFLSNNPWRCDCLFTPSFQDLLLKYRSYMKDADDVKCSNEEGDENSNKRIITLSRTSICRFSEYLINPLDLVNVILASLIILVLGKLAYDYYTFKKTGHLPWIVTKMP